MLVWWYTMHDDIIIRCNDEWFEYIKGKQQSAIEKMQLDAIHDTIYNTIQWKKKQETKKESTIWKIVAAHSVCLTDPWRRWNIMVLVPVNNAVEIGTLGNT